MIDACRVLGNNFLLIIHLLKQINSRISFLHVQLKNVAIKETLITE